MISVIVCSKQPPRWDNHKRNVHKTIGFPYEYIRINNADGNYGICAAYNEGVSQAKGDVLVFVHEDVFFMEPGWGHILIQKFKQNNTLGLVGVAGTQYLLHDHPAWLAAGQPFIRGRVVHQTNGGQSYYLTVFSWDQSDAEVVAVDGLFFAVKRELFETIRFDDKTFDKFHFYDLDICMQIRRSHKILVTWDILVKHLSMGNCDDAWKESGQRFLEKYGHELPASCVDTLPKATGRNLGMNYDLKYLLPVKRMSS